MDILDCTLVNLLQDGIEVTEQPYRDVAARLGISEAQVVQRIGSLLKEGYLSRFGPMFDAEKMGGAVSLCAMQVPPQELDEVADKVNALAEVAHNYERSHVLNMWFVVATEYTDQLEEVLHRIETITGYPVYNMPKLEEYYIGLRLDAEAIQ